MARRRLLTPAQRLALLALPVDRVEAARHYTLGEVELATINRRRGGRNRLGFALQLCALRYPGRLLHPGEKLPHAVVAFVAEQIGVAPEALGGYASRPNTKYEHSAALQNLLGWRPFEGRPRREIEGWLDQASLTVRTGAELAVGFRDELRRRKIIVPGITVIERLCAAALTRCERTVLARLTEGLDREQSARLDRLLDIGPDAAGTWLGWLRQSPGAASAATFHTIIERLRRVREVGIDGERATRVPRHHLVRLAREGERLSLSHLRGLSVTRRRGILVATMLELGPRLTDEALDMHDKLVGRMFRRAERRQLAALGHDRRVISRTLRLFAKAGAELVAARADGRDGFAAIEGAVGWDRFTTAVEEAQALTGRHSEDPVELIQASYTRLRRYTPLLLETFAFRGVPAVRPLLEALELLHELNRTGRRTLPADAPTGFVPRRWQPFVMSGGRIDRRFWELCAMAELKNRLRAGDVWVAGSRRYRSLDDDLLPLDRAVEQIAAVDPVMHDAASFLRDRKQQLAAALGEVERQAAGDQLPDAGIRNGRLAVAPLQASTPKEVTALSELLYGVLPRVRITDLLEEVDRWTGFTGCFTHLKTGLPPGERRTLLTAVLADGINMGLKRMAEACRGASFWQLARVVDWHVREETYVQATARLVDAQRTLPIAMLWGDGTMSSSDGQFFQAGGHGLAPSEVNARYGSEPGVSFYSHLSDQFGAFYSKVIAATAHEAPHILDGLLLHESGLRIERHTTDTGGFTETVFALCALLGFRFVPRIRDLPATRLYTFDHPRTWPTLEPVIGGRLHEQRIIDGWPDLLWLVGSIRAGTVVPSHVITKLAANPRQSSLARALIEVGRLEHTRFLLDLLRSPTLRHEMQASLNKGEASNNLRKAVFFNRLGQVRDRAYESQLHRARGLNLLVAAIVLWNSRYLDEAVGALRRHGYDVPDPILAHVWPLAWDHINLTGDYTWSGDAPPDSARLRDLRLDQLTPPLPLQRAA
jgi:TnpA family transposase